MNPIQAGRHFAGQHPRQVQIGGSIVIAIVSVLLVIRAVRPAEVGETLAGVSPGLVLLAVPAAFAFISARAWRYQLLLGSDRRVPRGAILPVTLSSWGASLLLPGPSGDAAFVLLARRRLNAPLTVGAGAAVLSRLLDLASLLLVALITAPPAGIALAPALLVAGLLLAVLIAAGLTALFWSRPRQLITGWLEGLPLPGRFHERLHLAIEELGSGSRPALLVTATVVARVATSLQYFALFAAIGHPLPLVQVWFALSIRTLLLAVPLQGVGGLGTTQLWWTAALTLLGWPADDALAASLAVHLLDLLISLPQAAAGWAILALRPGAEPSVQPVEAEAQRL